MIKKNGYLENLLVFQTHSAQISGYSNTWTEWTRLSDYSNTWTEWTRLGARYKLPRVFDPILESRVKKVIDS